ncbi:neutral ceramidase [Phragmites australis]|uniref:neutral ceramidase n=1 Tax=Phragmites australis TaxID=29695 RepID=UPI002D789D70|nr:neutral ceramidase [Phragmites australis]XP_062206207.1 neutral ceramidase [Phragmites australis]XP_062206214.1 neutral ceramidase [Phragmites australis]
METSSCLRYQFCGFGSPMIWLCLFLVLVLQNSSPALTASPYLVGMGSYDITGPAADVNMMGYANTEQIASGIHFRLKARAFIVAEPNGKRVVFVNLDACMASQLVTIKVLERLKARYGDLYNENNVAISGIHTHAGPGGYLQYVVYIVTSLGFVHQSFNVIVNGIEQCIVDAHNNLRPGKIYVNKGDLLDAGVNRSPSAYLNNPAEERSKYQYNVDKEMTLIKFVDDELGPVGSFNWFATHGTSMSRTNSLISGDNKGAAARFMEDWAEQNGIPKQAAHVNSDDLESLHKISGLPRRVSSIIPEPNEITDDLVQLASSYEASGGRRLSGSSITRRIRSSQQNRPKFVSAFCQSNCGDVSPNVLGTFCIDTGLPCDFNHSTCNGKNELCYGRGPGYPDEFESTRIIGNRQFLKAVDLFNSASEEIQGKVDYRHTYLDFSQLEVNVPTSSGGQQVVKTCPAAMGFAFAAGTTDGPGAFDFKQGDVKGNPFWTLVRNLLKTPGKEQVECQAPKPILLDTGEMTEPYDWAPAILPIQIIRIGQLVILCVPGEFTTMSGRRLRDAVKNVLTSDNSGEFNNNIHVVLAGLTNTYSQYITTFEEYQIQRYEGASTLYGPHTLSAYIQEFQKLATAMIANKEVPTNFQPPDLLDKQIGLLPGVMFDSTPPGVNFGDVSSDVPAKSTFRKGSIVNATFYSACPRNDLLTDGTFALVEKLDGSDNWVPVYDDDDWSLQFKWSRPAKFSPRSFATLEWTIPEDAALGVYRLRHFGASKPLFGSIKHFTGTSRAFAVR